MPAWMASPFQSSIGGRTAKACFCYAWSLYVPVIRGTMLGTTSFHSGKMLIYQLSAPKPTFRHHWRGLWEVSCICSQSFSFFHTIDWKIVTIFFFLCECFIEMWMIWIKLGSLIIPFFLCPWIYPDGDRISERSCMLMCSISFGVTEQKNLYQMMTKGGRSCTGLIWNWLH